jgi:hypothetical protein
MRWSTLQACCMRHTRYAPACYRHARPLHCTVAHCTVHACTAGLPACLVTSTRRLVLHKSFLRAGCRRSTRKVDQEVGLGRTSTSELACDANTSADTQRRRSGQVSRADGDALLFSWSAAESQRDLQKSPMMYLFCQLTYFKFHSDTN